MMDSQLPPDVIGFMAALGGTNDPLELCPSCQRALIYAAAAHLSSTLVAIQEFDASRARAHATFALRTLLDLVKVDFAGAVPGADEMDTEAHGLAITSFYDARVEHYCDGKTGAIIFEPHGDEGDPVGAGV